MASGLLPKFRKVANERPHWYCLIIAIGVVSLATGARFWMHGTVGGAVPFILYYPAVMLAAWAGGFSCGFVATVLSGLAAHYFFIEPRYALAGSPPLVVALIVFVLSSLFISFLAELRLRAITRERTAVEREKESAARERHLRELLENEKRFAEQILSSIGDVFLVVGFDWRIVYANEHFARGALSSKKELEGQYVWKMIPHMEAVDRPHMEKVMTERVPVRFETGITLASTHLKTV